MMNLHKRIIGAAAAAVMFISGSAFQTAASDEMAHDPSRDVQNEGVGNPFNYGERNTPADASTEEIRRINHEMSVQEVKYALYKEIDEHWELLRVRLGEELLAELPLVAAEAVPKIGLGALYVRLLGSLVGL